MKSFNIFFLNLFLITMFTENGLEMFCAQCYFMFCSYSCLVVTDVTNDHSLNTVEPSSQVQIHLISIHQKW